MQLNRQKIAGNLAEDATIRSAGENRDVLTLRVITNRRIGRGDQAREVATGHTVVRFGKAGQFNKFAEGYLKKGMPVYAEGITEKETSEKDGATYLNVTINASFGGDIQPLKASMSLNEQEIAGYLAADAVIRDTANGEALSFTVITTNSWYNGQETKEKQTAHNVVKFGKKGEFSRQAELLKKGAGVHLSGVTEKENVEREGKKYLNVTLNATFQNVSITKYASEKQPQNNAQAPQQQAAAQQPVQQTVQAQGGEDFDPENPMTDIPF